MVMERLDPMNPLIILHIRPAGTIMDQSLRYTIIVPLAISHLIVQDLGKIETCKYFYLKLSFSDRGRCYFWGQVSNLTSMWQTVNMIGSIDFYLIDTHTVWFNFSTWLGGYSTQDDNAQVLITFFDQTNQKVGNSTTLGPVSAAQRGGITSLIFQQASGLIPIGARSFIVIVTLTCVSPQDNDGLIDNIAVVLYQ